MLLPVTVLVRTSASEPPEERMVGINPEEVARVEEGDEAGTVQLWCGGQSPMVIRGTVEELIGAVNTLMSDEEER
mgnify:CR=1 FL=1